MPILSSLSADSASGYGLTKGREKVYGIDANPVAWYAADSLSSISIGTVWPNLANQFSPHITTDFAATTAGTVVSNWSNGHKAWYGAAFSADISGETSTLNQNGNFTMIVVAATDGVGFTPYFGVGQHWGSYSQAYGGYYWHGLYGNWGHFTATPAVVGHKHTSGQNSLTVFSNSNYASDSFDNYVQANAIAANTANSSGDLIAEILIYSSVLSDADINTVTTALRTKYSF